MRWEISVTETRVIVRFGRWEISQIHLNYIPIILCLIPLCTTGMSLKSLLKNTYLMNVLLLVCYTCA